MTDFTENEVREQAVSELIAAVRAGGSGTEFVNPEREFIARRVIEHADEEPARQMWAEYFCLFLAKEEE